MDNVIVASKQILESILSLNMYSPLLGVLIGVYITYKLIIDKERIMEASDAYKTVYGSLYIKLSSIKTNIEVMKKQYGRSKFNSINKQSKVNKYISLTALQIVNVSDEILKVIQKNGQDKLSITVLSRYFEIEHIKEQIKLAEISVLGGWENQDFREGRIARLHYELAYAKISFVQVLLEDMLEISKAAKFKNKETKLTIYYLKRLCKKAKKKDLSKKYGVDISKNIKIFDVVNKSTG